MRALAWSTGSEMAACSWLLRTPVQDLLGELRDIAMASSLPVERAHSEVKKWEAPRLTHIAVASRNAICMRFLKWGEEQCRAIACSAGLCAPTRRP